ncbi:hypothetical protein [Corynebacterium uterequi]|uniref:Beta-N-acetylglucosaminidase n=1 Tax=Corynebacterium uterequi TaxID=1072256 RepID=A0A0G3HB62_9CORY|nr:hypothetical protein [Corynebacterium uterequi]AKK10554.1 hypothetical protein CUTER_02695 [Corynebacterium uterequi]
MIASSRRARRLGSAAVSMIALTSGLVACTPGDTDGLTTEASPTATSAATSTTTTSTSPTASSSAPASTTSPTGSTTTATAEPSLDPAELGEGVAAARQRFSTLAPDSLWAKMEVCNETTVEDVVDCQGRDIGQFQLSDSSAKAARTTKMLTELRTSTVVTDNGEFVVGWTVLGTDAMIYVVDNSTGQVLQQMLPSDIAEPSDRIRELGLA